MAKVKNGAEAPQAENVETSTMTETTPQATPPTSEKLTELEGRLKEVGQSVATFEVGSDEWNAAIQSVVSVKKEIEAEKANIVRAENERRLQDARNAKIAVLDHAIEMAISNGIDSEEAKVARDAAINELLSGAKLAVPRGTSTPSTGSKGGVTQQIKDAYAAILAENPSIPYKEARERIEAQGFARGTVGAATLEYRREHNLP